MSKLTTGGNSDWPEHWEAELTPVCFFWAGSHPATKEDIAALKARVRHPFHYGGPMSGFSSNGMDDPPIAEDSLVGHFHADYAINGKHSSRGGVGSQAYETQHLPRGIKVPGSHRREKIKFIERKKNPDYKFTFDKVIHGHRIVWNPEKRWYEVVK